MRDIKFRAWSKEHKKLITVRDLKWSAGNNLVSISEREVGNRSWWYNISAITLMQFTGLKDKNGKEIYEGDILRFEYKNMHDGSDLLSYVVYDDKNARFALRALIEQPLIQMGTGTVFYEVIGNIHENPELIGE